MKVLLLNGSPHEKGCTYTALAEAAGELERCGVDAEIFHIKQPQTGCMGCARCREIGKCVFEKDLVNTVIEKAAQCDGFIFGSPVHYASASGNITAFWTAAFMPAGQNLHTSPEPVS